MQLTILALLSFASVALAHPFANTNTTEEFLKRDTQYISNRAPGMVSGQQFTDNNGGDCPDDPPNDANEYGLVHLTKDFMTDGNGKSHCGQKLTIWYYSANDNGLGGGGGIGVTYGQVWGICFTCKESQAQFEDTIIKAIDPDGHVDWYPADPQFGLWGPTIAFGTI